MSTRMQPLQEMLKLACDKIVSYITKLEEQNVRSKRSHLETEKTTNISDHAVTPIKMNMGCDPSWLQKLDSLHNDLTNQNHFHPIEISRQSLNASSRQSYHQIIEKILNKGVPFKLHDIYLFHFKLPSAGPHASVHFVWKQPADQPVNCPEQAKLITDIRAQAKVYYTRAMKADVRQRSW